MYEDGKTNILISLADDMRQSHTSPRLRTGRLIIADLIYLVPDESIGCPRNYFTSKLTIMGHIMQCLHVPTRFKNSHLLHVDAENCAHAVFTLGNLEFFAYICHTRYYVYCM